MDSTIYILLLDDDPMSNLINERIFQISGYDVKISIQVDAKETLEKLKKIATEEKNKFPNLIFVDINMTGMDGWEFVEEFIKFPKTLLNNCHFYLLTSSLDMDDVSKSNTYSIIKEIISKPITEEIAIKYLSEIKQKLYGGNGTILL